MKAYAQLTEAERKAEYAELLEKYDRYCAMGLKLNMARGKPSAAQLDMVSDICSILSDSDSFVCDGVDVRNYGELMGLPSARRLFADLLGVEAEEVMVGGNSSLELMFDLVSKAYTHGLLHSERPWAQEKTVKFLCPVPGYDRHFKISESFGMEMIPIPLTENGPDMEAVEEAVKDPCVKGMWCVPKFSNPDGITYSDETVRRIASLRPAAADFALIWDNAYCIHEIFSDFEPFCNILSVCRENGNADMVYEFASTSKITFPGAGVAVMASSAENLKHIESVLTCQTISFDKVNQLRHVLYLKDKEHTLSLMRRHAEILRPKFEAVLETLKNDLEPLNIAHWSNPRGGYFVSFYAMPHTAKRIVGLMKQAGIVMTAAGATYPHGFDPSDSNIRIAPTLPPVEEVKLAMEVFTVCVRLAALERLGATDCS